MQRIEPSIPHLSLASLVRTAPESEFLILRCDGHTYLILLWGLNDIIHAMQWKRCLACSRCLIKAHHCYYHHYDCDYPLAYRQHHRHSQWDSSQARLTAQNWKGSSRKHTPCTRAETTMSLSESLAAAQAAKKLTSLQVNEQRTATRGWQGDGWEGTNKEPSWTAEVAAGLPHLTSLFRALSLHPESRLLSLHTL